MHFAHLNTLKLRLRLTFLSTLLCIIINIDLNAQVRTHTIKSPDNNITATVFLDNNLLKYSVNYKGKKVIEHSSLGFEISVIKYDNAERLISSKTEVIQNQVESAGFKSFNTISRTIQNNYETILNYFDNRSTNASAESFNAKIKAFRAQFRGVRNVKFFLFRLTKVYA